MSCVLTAKMQQPFVLLGLATLITILLAAYRLAAHPLARFPGPRVAAVSGLFLFYHDVVLGGKLHLELQRLHARYGDSYLDPPCHLTLQN